MRQIEPHTETFMPIVCNFPNRTTAKALLIKLSTFSKTLFIVNQKNIIAVVQEKKSCWRYIIISWYLITKLVLVKKTENKEEEPTDYQPI